MSRCRKADTTQTACVTKCIYGVDIGEHVSSLILMQSPRICLMDTCPPISGGRPKRHISPRTPAGSPLALSSSNTPRLPMTNTLDPTEDLPSTTPHTSMASPSALLAEMRSIVRKLDAVPAKIQDSELHPAVQQATQLEELVSRVLQSAHALEAALNAQRSKLGHRNGRRTSAKRLTHKW